MPTRVCAPRYTRRTGEGAAQARLAMLSTSPRRFEQHCLLCNPTFLYAVASYLLCLFTTARSLPLSHSAPPDPMPLFAGWAT